MAQRGSVKGEAGQFSTVGDVVERSSEGVSERTQSTDGTARPTHLDVNDLDTADTGRAG